MSETTKRTWQGTPPKACDLCGAKLQTAFVDGRTKQGPWRKLCVACHRAHGTGLGVGNGQRYERSHGEWVKTAG
jgi:cytochrome c553